MMLPFREELLLKELQFTVSIITIMWNTSSVVVVEVIAAVTVAMCFSCDGVYLHATTMVSINHAVS